MTQLIGLGDLDPVRLPGIVARDLPGDIPGLAASRLPGEVGLRAPTPTLGGDTGLRPVKSGLVGDVGLGCGASGLLAVAPGEIGRRTQVSALLRRLPRAPPGTAALVAPPVVLGPLLDIVTREAASCLPAEAPGDIGPRITASGRLLELPAEVTLRTASAFLISGRADLSGNRGWLALLPGDRPSRSLAVRPFCGLLVSDPCRPGDGNGEWPQGCCNALTK
mmetsp:Transcript_15346/g.38844  ORF Transcript_15346/g.38844 Transcript_15346/m.38844 type:complete len:221 (-) Transcript_15346:1456-2118(-)